MKIFIAVTVLCALSSVSQAAEQTSRQGIIYFSGAVVDSNCTLSTYGQNGLSENCPMNAVPHTLTAHSLNKGQNVRVHSKSKTQGSAPGEHQYELVSLTGRLITQGRYVVTQALQ